MTGTWLDVFKRIMIITRKEWKENFRSKRERVGFLGGQKTGVKGQRVQRAREKGGGRTRENAGGVARRET